MLGKTKVFFRANGNSEIGLGHVVRSLALSDMLKNDFDCVFIITNPDQALKNLILKSCNELIELKEFEDDLDEARALTKKYIKSDDILVLDGYHFITAYQKIIKSSGCKLVCIDDIHEYHFLADMIINHAGSVTEELYSAEEYTQFCFGLNYALLRKPFIVAAKKRSQVHSNDNVFICLGGADPNNNVLKVLKKCEELEALGKCKVVVGSAYAYGSLLSEFVESSHLDVTVLKNLSAEDMVQQMSECDKAITSPSTISYEYLSVGGELYLIQTADNQSDINNYFISSGLAFVFDEFPINNSQRVKEAFGKQIAMLDANIGDRFIDKFKAL